MMKTICSTVKIRRVIYSALIMGLLLTNISLQSYADEEDEKKQIMVSLGDSYSSGEGILSFYGENDVVAKKVHNPDWLAHRSQKSWPGMLRLPDLEGKMSDYKDEYWYFVAASGAVTDNLKYAFSKEYKKGEYEGRYNLEPQLNIFDDIGQNETDYVTLTLGGNDVGFASIIGSCYLTYLNIGNLSDKLNYTWDYFYANGGTKDKLRDAYVSIAEKAGPQAQIIVAGYPKLLSENGGGLIRREDAKEVNKNITKFNNALEDIVDNCSQSGIKISFVSVENEFEGHGAFSDDPYISSIKFLAREEDLKNSQLISAYSVHPNYEGACAYAKSVQRKIDEIEAEKKSDKIKKDLSSNTKATDDELDAKAKHFMGIVLQPEDVVLKMFDALQKGNYKRAVECLDPATEQQINFWGGIASTLIGLFTGEYVSWGQLLLEAAGATEVDVIECYSEYMAVESNIDLLEEWIPKIPGLRNLVCTEADVYVKYRYKYKDEYFIEEETYHVRRYEWSGWRIEEEY